MISEKENTPIHVAIIPDGNRRWAKEHKKPAYSGHLEGYKRVKELVRTAKDSGIKYLTLWAFSTENWSRSKEEVAKLSFLIAKGVEELHKEALKEHTRVIHIGRKDRIHKGILKAITAIEEETKHFNGFCVCMAIDYGGLDEVMRATELFSKNKKKGSSVYDFLDTHRLGIPDPDLIIRTSGEKRTSGFMPLQSTYAEWVFDERPFPLFTKGAFKEALKEFSKRNRRFGK
jgi:undecaprenyl diphosphate synthase